jgi:flagellar hook-associated protein 3 FlgL
MRITPTIQNRNFLEDLALSKARMDRAQEQMSSGLRVNSLSDDPYAAEQASEISAVLSENDEFIANNDQLISKLTYLDNTLQGLIRTLDTARTLAAQALSGTTTAESRATLVEGADWVRKQVLSISNAQHNGVFMFSGTRRPAGDAFVDNAPGFTYNGNDEAIYQRLDRSTTIQTNISGQDLFGDPPAMLDVLDTMKTAIQNNDTAAIRAAADDLELLSERVNSQAATVGNRVQLAENTQSRLREHNLALKKESSRLVDANLVESISAFNLADQAVKVSLSSQARIEQLSLLDYLR